MKLYQSPEVSVLLPVRNAAETLAECLDSILSQTLEDLEIIAVDDHSNDDSRSTLERYASKDSRIQIKDTPRRGLVAALNHGLSHCRADLVARMDADDLMHPERLAAQLSHLQSHPDIALSATQTNLFPEEIIEDGYREYQRWQDRCHSSQEIANNIYVESPFAHPSVCFRKQTITQLGGYREGDFPEDYELWLRLHTQGYKMAKLPFPYLNWREAPDRTSRVDSRYRREAFDHIRAEYLHQDPRLRAASERLVIWGAGRKTRRRAEKLLAYGFTPSTWIDIDPRKIGNTCNGVPIVGPEWIGKQKVKPFVLVYVTNHGARDLIITELESIGLLPGTDFLCIG
ncbi:MAG: glycosyltransferase [bacterium]